MACSKVIGALGAGPACCANAGLTHKAKAMQAIFITAYTVLLGCPILRGFCGGGGKQNVRGSVPGAEHAYPPLRKKREGWGGYRGNEQLPLPAVAAWGTRLFSVGREFP